MPQKYIDEIFNNPKMFGKSISIHDYQTGCVNTSNIGTAINALICYDKDQKIIRKLLPVNSNECRLYNYGEEENINVKLRFHIDACNKLTCARSTEINEYWPWQLSIYGSDKNLNCLTQASYIRVRDGDFKKSVFPK